MALERFNDYLRRLPRGLESYPELTQRASGLRLRFELCDIAHYANRLPEPLGQLVRSPPHWATWLPEVHVHALTLAMADLCFEDDASFDAASYAINRRVLDGPVFSILFRLLGPHRVARGAARRWEQLHRNSVLRTVRQTSNACELLLEAPPFHVPPLVARTYAIGIRVALELSGAGAVEVVPESLDERRTRYLASWS